MVWYGTILFSFHNFATMKIPLTFTLAFLTTVKALTPVDPSRVVLTPQDTQIPIPQAMHDVLEQTAQKSPEELNMIFRLPKENDDPYATVKHSLEFQQAWNNLAGDS